MHIEPGIVNGLKIGLSYGTAIVAFGFVAKESWSHLKENNPLSLVVKSILTTLLVFSFFEIFPHYPVGVSEVHLILGTTLFLLFGLVPTAIGLSLGLLMQGVLFAQFDLPQYGMNITTLLMTALYISSFLTAVRIKQTLLLPISVLPISTDIVLNSWSG